MKKTIGLLTVLAALVFTCPAQTNTNTTPSGFLGWLEDGGQRLADAMPTNIAIVPYATYAQNAPVKWGGGAMIVYNISQNIGTGLGVDWLGSFSSVSGTFELKIPMKPLSFIGLTNFVVTPFVDSGLSSPMSGAGSDNQTVSIFAGGGAFFDITKLAGGQLFAGVAAENWNNAGAFSGWHEHLFLGWRKGF